ncbi:hypothetical protein SKAU_G00087140 [Synaphobranchus kaupii]|uniref:Galectin n=1 Tax=Synaphobranchus kaupii TaxID=118154 RepID=A0A9Q1J635_SYNKA|nr:hypothetical protein SKAU_G00087140 [Synaphobranchus kaupii]
MYKHRIPVDRVSSLLISGTISVQAINIITGGQEGIQECPGPGDVSGSTDGEGEGGTGCNWRFLPMMGTEPIFNPPVPYTGMIPGGMIRKKTIVIRGKVLPGANRFYMNFGSCSSEDLALHFNPRMSERSVVRNSFLHGSWGTEERNVNFNPFQEGQSFEILIRCGSQKMKFFGNGKHLFDYVHRLQPFTKIDKLHINGDVQLFYILF